MVATGGRDGYNGRAFILNRSFDDRGQGARPRGPKPVSEILGDLFASRGLARVRALGELEAAWGDAVGEAGRRHTKVDGLRRGILSVTVAHPTLLEELASFQKANLLAALRQSMAGTRSHDIRFRVGPIEPDPAGSELEPKNRRLRVLDAVGPD